MGKQISICLKCGKQLDTATKFCSECGGKVKTYDEAEVKFVCSKCGQEFPVKWNFCHDCAGKIVTTIPYSYFCQQCGKLFEKEAKFCPECGGKIERSGGVIGDAAEVANQASEKPASEPQFCPGCGQNTLVDGFCTQCGYTANGN